jgi:nitrous oxide reductase
MKDTLHQQVQLGLGPLHTQFDSTPCEAYTSLYVDSQVAKWDYCKGKVLDKIAIHYNVGHLDDHGRRHDEAPWQVPHRPEQAGHRPLQPGGPAASRRTTS